MESMNFLCEVYARDTHIGDFNIDNIIINNEPMYDNIFFCNNTKEFEESKNKDNFIMSVLGLALGKFGEAVGEPKVSIDYDTEEKEYPVKLTNGSKIDTIKCYAVNTDTEEKHWGFIAERRKDGLRYRMIESDKEE